MALNQEDIAKSALVIVQKDGLEALTMRRLAKDLGVKAASLYNHIKSKDDLYDLMQSYAYSHKKHLPFKSDWQAHLRALAIMTYEGVIKNPNLLPLFATRPILSEAALKQINETLAGLVEHGFSLQKALWAFHHVHVYVLGFALAEVGKPPGADEHYQEPSIVQTNVQQYPMLEALKKNIGKRSPRASFLFGLDCLISGIEQQVLLGEKS